MRDVLSSKQPLLFQSTSPPANNVNLPTGTIPTASGSRRTADGLILSVNTTLVPAPARASPQLGSETRWEMQPNFLQALEKQPLVSQTPHHLGSNRLKSTCNALRSTEGRSHRSSRVAISHPPLVSVLPSVRAHGSALEELQAVISAAQRRN